MINPQNVCREHGFDTVEIGWAAFKNWRATAHGKDVGEFGCNFGYGATPETALSDLMKNIRVHREDKAAIAAGNREAKAKRIAAIKAELASLTGEPA